jgi:ribosomal 50S subunit-recycling heat shock protein
MRLDLFLSKVCLLKTRSQAARALERDQIRVNGDAPRASRGIRAGDVIEVRTDRRELRVRVLAVPEGNVSRRDAKEYYETLEDRRRDGWDEDE